MNKCSLLSTEALHNYVKGPREVQPKETEANEKLLRMKN